MAHSYYNYLFVWKIQSRDWICMIAWKCKSTCLMRPIKKTRNPIMGLFFLYDSFMLQTQSELSWFLKQCDRQVLWMHQHGNCDLTVIWKICHEDRRRKWPFEIHLSTCWSVSIHKAHYCARKINPPCNHWLDGRTEELYIAGGGENGLLNFKTKYIAFNATGDKHFDLLPRTFF